MNLISIITLLQLALALLNAVAELPKDSQLYKDAISFSNKAVIAAREELMRPMVLPRATPIGVPAPSAVSREEFPQEQQVVQPSAKEVDIWKIDPAWDYYIQQSKNEETGNYNISFWFHSTYANTVNRVIINNISQDDSSTIEFQGLAAGIYFYQIRVELGDKFGVLEGSFETKDTNQTIRLDS